MLGIYRPAQLGLLLPAHQVAQDAGAELSSDIVALLLDLGGRQVSTIDARQDRGEYALIFILAGGVLTE
jgi:hypothetical protein